MHKLIQCILRFFNNMHLIHKHGDTDWCTVKLSLLLYLHTSFSVQEQPWLQFLVHPSGRFCAFTYMFVYILNTIHMQAHYTSDNHLTIFYFQCSKWSSLLYLLVGHRYVYQIFWGQCFIDSFFFFLPIICSVACCWVHRIETVWICL